MTAQQVLDMLMQYRMKLKEFGVRKIGVFGSYSRGKLPPIATSIS